MWAPLIKENMESNKITMSQTDVLTGVDTPARAASVQAISAASDFYGVCVFHLGFSDFYSSLFMFSFSVQSVPTLAQEEIIAVLGQDLFAF